MREQVPPKFGSSAELLCPSCGGGYLHHVRTELFDRREDESECLHVVVGDHKALVMRDQGEGNPSGRRDGLLIHMDCEWCDVDSVLTIAQHKGVTYMELLPKVTTP